MSQPRQTVRFVRAAAALATLPAIIPATAQAQDAPEASIDCRNAMTQSEMTACAVKGFEAADAELNLQWKDTLAVMQRWDARGDSDPTGDTTGYAEALIAAQRDWIAFRDSHCRVEGFAARGGSLQPMLEAGCKESLTRERTLQLRDLSGQLMM